MAAAHTAARLAAVPAAADSSSRAFGQDGRGAAAVLTEPTSWTRYA
jgi:hypothetical protein